MAKPRTTGNAGTPPTARDGSGPVGVIGGFHLTAAGESGPASEIPFLARRDLRSVLDRRERLGLRDTRVESLREGIPDRAVGGGPDQRRLPVDRKTGGDAVGGETVGGWVRKVNRSRTG